MTTEYRLVLMRERTVTYTMGINETGRLQALDAYDRHSIVGDCRIESREVGSWIPLRDTRTLDLEEEQ